ncbi:hypothetical protein [Thermosulfurimonas dismutans]|uniref:Uncharacterized protein n=1 Tax=Thermosulfurimonas dismutans TaxID=999894 RepID=A0A179D5J9_9BACT|nr:hypothetical protein [Thermosulfurimonas dismutans]OAQ20868.1 hypothetical protein TDIS_0994 [Thermosulfurimonas dismutans]
MLRKIGAKVLLLGLALVLGVGTISAVRAEKEHMMKPRMHSKSSKDYGMMMRKCGDMMEHMSKMMRKKCGPKDMREMASMMREMAEQMEKMAEMMEKGDMDPKEMQRFHQKMMEMEMKMRHMDSKKHD